MAALKSGFFQDTGAGKTISAFESTSAHGLTGQEAGDIIILKCNN